MTGLAIRWVATLVGVLASAFILREQIQFTDFLALAIFAAVLALLNALVKPLLTFLTCPFVLLTLGLFVLIINAALFILADRIVPGFSVVADGTGQRLLYSFLAALIVSAVSTVVSRIVR